MLENIRKKGTIVIAEAGVNHNGKLDIALRMCDAAKEANADVVKFQTWNTDKLITQSLKMADYQLKNTGVRESQYDMLKRLELQYEDFVKIKEHCDKIGIIFASTADEIDSLDFLVELGMPFIKIGSGDIGNIPFLRHVGKKGLPVVLSTGMSNLQEVESSITALKEGGASDICLLHCTSNYPCPYNEVNLKAMLTLRDTFGVPVGYSDHTIGTEVAVSAVAMGAWIIEKHFTLDRNMEGPDHIASTEPKEFGKMVQQIRNIESALGDGEKKMTHSEKSVRDVVTKRIVAYQYIPKGKKLTEENICVKRSDTGCIATLWDSVLGSVAITDYKKDEGIKDEQRNDRSSMGGDF